MTVTDDTTYGSTAVRLEPAYDDPAGVLACIRGAGPFWPISRYAASETERRAVGGEDGSGTYVPPWFREDFALLGEELVPGAGVILGNPRFVDAARQVYGPGTIVEPSTVYVNVMVPGPVPFVPHTDVPAFRGFTRTDQPIWLLNQMMASGLFERWRVRLATAVSWFYDGPGGAFLYWPDGPDGPVQRIDAPYGNVAVVADNERTYHGVEPVGSEGDGFVGGLTLDSQLHRVDGGWEMRTGTAVVGAASDQEVRITVSWKGEVFADAEEQARCTSGEDEIDLAFVVDTFLADLRRRGVDVVAPDDPRTDETWMATITDTYRRRPPRAR